MVVNEEDENIRKIFNFQFSIFNENPKSKIKIQKYNSENKYGLHLKIPGKHNLSNANAALAAARVLGIDARIAIEALNDFPGVWRRMEYKGGLNGAKIYDDYGHHPTEIKTTLEGARELLIFPTLKMGIEGDLNPSPPPFKKGGERRLWCVFQPHQYRRTYELFDKFVGAFGAADKVILLPIYSVAGREDEEIKKQVSSEKLAEAIKTINNQQSTTNNKQNKQEVLCIKNFVKAAEYLCKNLKSGDVCVIMGAGDIYKLTEKLFRGK